MGEIIKVFTRHVGHICRRAKNGTVSRMGTFGRLIRQANLRDYHDSKHIPTLQTH